MDTTTIIIIIVFCICISLSITGGIVGAYYGGLLDASKTTKSPIATNAPIIATNAPIISTNVPIIATTPDPYNEYKYRGNNGSISGDTYCKGGWESIDGKDKNMKCIDGVILTSGEKVNCIDSINKPGLAYKCILPPPPDPYAEYNYRGNNGSISGDTYCKGGWESIDGKDKNMKCIDGVILTSGEKVNCIDSINKPGLAYKCALSTIQQIKDGQAVKCNINDATVYRYMNGELRPYPSPSTASSWDPDWEKNLIYIDCSNVKTGKNMNIKGNYNTISGDAPGNDILTINSSSIDNCTSQCDDNSECVGFIVDNFNCKLKSKIENNILDTTKHIYYSNKVIPCKSSSGNVYLPGTYNSGLACPYQGPGASYTCSAGNLSIDYSKCIAAPKIGTTYKCNKASAISGNEYVRIVNIPNTTTGSMAFYKQDYTGNIASPMATNIEILNNWEPNYTKVSTIDCNITALIQNQMIDYKFPANEGDSVKCAKNSPTGDRDAVYRIENNILRHYPSSDIAASWDPNWANPKMIDCYGIGEGNIMTVKQPTQLQIATQNIKTSGSVSTSLAF